MRTKTRKALVAVAAVAAFTATGVPTAHAVDAFCGPERVDYLSVKMQSCFDQDPNGLWTFRPIAKFHSTAIGTWTSCTIYVALYDNSVKVRQTQESCLTYAHYKIAHTFVGAWFTPQSNHCYTTQARWVGTLNGAPVASGANSRSSGGPCG